MHGREGEEKKRRWHMWPGPPLGTTPVADSSLDFFCKDGRKVSIGDCALFQAGNSPPFIGIIRSLSGKGDNPPKLGVNWLYRPGDIKLNKGILLEASPNEVFYSFHKDEIPAASLLHPCKVAFLRKGVELPSGISSFVCRRVYDIANKRLWWLTDKDYINERQEEVDQLLDKTRQEMHAAVQSGGRSPKPLNGPSSTQQVTSGSDNIVLNSSTTVSHQGKGKKRDRGDQGTENIKRERLSQLDEGDPSLAKPETSIKSEIGWVTDGDGVIHSVEAVGKLIKLMQLDRKGKKIDWEGRMMAAKLISATDNDDHLGQFVQLRGVPILDEWLQEAHKGKNGEGSSPRESDKSVDEFLLSLLRALDKLPVNLHALQTCNVGKSVNHLRSHKNLEIQKKARSLVDTWKKRVEAEMKMSDAKSGQSQTDSWGGKPGGSDVCHGGNRRSGASSEAIIKSSITQPSASKALIKGGHVDPVKSTSSSSPGSVKPTASVPSSAIIVSKQGSDMSLMPIKEERSSNSSQSQNNSQSCSSDHVKSLASGCKDDARSTNAGSVSASKNLTSASCNRKPSNGYVNSGVAGAQKDAGIVKCGANKNAIPDKVSQSGLLSERAGDVASGDHANSQRLIVRLPNPGRSPARSMSGGSLEDPSATVSRASSPVVSEKIDPYDRKAKVKGDAYRSSNATDVNNESWQSNDLKDGFGGSDEGDRSPGALPAEQQSKSTEETGKLNDRYEKALLSSENEMNSSLPDKKPSKQYDSSLSSINALIESCVKDSEDASTPLLPVEDDMGMNLLASVAAGEMSKSGLTSSSGSLGRNSPAGEDASNMHDAKLALACPDSSPEVQDGLDQSAACNLEKEDADMGSSPAEHRVLQSVSVVNTNNASSENGYNSCKLSDNNSLREQTVRSLDSEANMKPRLKTEEMAEHERNACLTSLASEGTYSVDRKEGLEAQVGHQPLDEGKSDTVGDNCDGHVYDKMKGNDASENGQRVIDQMFEKKTDENIVGVPSDDMPSAKLDTGDIVESVSSVEFENEGVEHVNCSPMETERSGHISLNVGSVQQQSPSSRARNLSDMDKCGKLLNSSEECAVKTVEVVERMGHLLATEEKPGNLTVSPTIPDNRVGENNITESTEEHLLERKVTPDHARPPAVLSGNNSEMCSKAAGSKLSGSEADEVGKYVSSDEVSADTGAKIDFDLNEGLPPDEGNHRDVTTSATTSGSSAVIHLPAPLMFSVSPLPTTSLPASITVAAAAKGPFLPPEDLLRSKGELGWKGSAATSAFRPAEPRKIMDTLLTSAEVSNSESNTGKKCRTQLDIDLNVADDRVFEDTAPQRSVPLTACELRLVGNSATQRSTGLDLDLNRVDESSELGMQFQPNVRRRLEVLPQVASSSLSSCGFRSGEVNVLRDFDLNDGPGVDEAAGLDLASRNHYPKSNVPCMPSVPGMRLNNAELGGFSSWPPPNSYSAVAIPSFLPDRGGDQQSYSIVTTAGAHQRIVGPGSGGTFGNDLYQTPVLSSSPMPFTSASPFRYAGFPFGTNFPVPSTSFSVGTSTYMDSSTGGNSCFPAAPSQLMGPGGALSSHYPRHYVISLPDVNTTTSGSDTNRKWNRQGCLDLNTGPGSTDGEGKDERLQPHSSRQFSIVGSSQALAEEQARMYQAVKRKEPEGGWEVERFSYKQPSWQ